MGTKKVTWNLNGKGVGTKTTVETGNGTRRTTVQNASRDFLGFKHASSIIRTKTETKRRR